MGFGAASAVDVRAPPGRHREVPGRVEDLDHTGLRIEPTVRPCLTGEPEHALGVERRGIEVGTRALVGQWECRDLEGGRIDGDDGVQPSVGDPRRTIRPDDDAVRAGAGAKRDGLDLATRRVQQAERAVVLAGVPDATVRGRGHVVGMRAGRHRELLDLVAIR